ncbi:MAG: PAS domain S-box protein [Methanomicrobiaceae archaeon]|nr:PAS domain S-box protein [Methanomicrobiaceae archaeon]
MKADSRIIAFIMIFAILFGLLFWFFDAALEFYYIREYFHSLIYYYPDSFLESLVFRVSSYSLFTRLLFLIGCIAGGMIVSFYVIRNIESKKALIQSEGRLKAIINSAFDAKILIDREGKILELNDKAALYFKKPEDELIGREVYSFFSGDRHEKRKSQIAEVISSKKPLQFDEEFEDHFYRLIFYPVIDENGKVSAVATTLRDITPEKRAEMEISESREYLALAMASAGISIWEMWEKQKKMIVINSDEISGGYGNKKKEDRYREFWNSVHPDDRDMIGDALQDHFSGKTENYSALYRMKDPKGDWIWVNSFGRVIERDEAGDPVKMIGIRVDVTNLHNYREAVIKANRKLNLLSEITRHDILNQVTAIRLSEEILLSEDHVNRNSEAWDLFEVIFKATGMIEKQISFTKDYQNLGIDSPKWQMMSEVMKEIDKEAALMNVRLYDYTGGLEIYADPMFEKVLFNLVENSYRHGVAKNLTAKYELNDNWCTLILEDDGSGIEEEIKDRIFDRGFGKNSGLGLFLAREILDITNIRIRETGIPGSGARFEILIPKEAFRESKE